MSGTKQAQGCAPTGPKAPLPPPTRTEVIRIALSMTGACAIGALILGAIYVGTARYQEAARTVGERTAVTEMLGLDSTATVTEVRQFLDRERREVLYDVGGEAAGTRIVFTLDGQLVSQGPRSADHAADPGAAEGKADKKLQPLGRLFVARKGGAPTGFVVEDEARGYKNTIRFFVALDGQFNVAGVRVVEHEEDPGLGAEVATRWFQGQYVGRTADAISTIDVTKDPMPEDWRAALAARARLSPAAWRAKNAALLERESSHPIYAVTGATISSRALTDGVRAAVDHFRRRWTLLAPHLEAGS